MIPRGARADTMVRLGTLYKRGSEVFIQYGDAGMVSVRRLLVMVGSFGSSYEGAEAMPRYGTLDADNNVVRPGDLVAVTCLDGNPRRPLLLGAVRRVNHEPFLAGALDEVEDPGRVRLRVEPRSASNEVTGRVDVRVAENGDGSVDVRATSQVVIRIGSNTEGDDFPVELTIDGSEVTVKAGAVRLVDPTSQKALALAEKCDDRITTLQQKHDVHVHPVAGVMPGVGAVTTSVTTATVGPLESVAAEATFGV